MKVKIIKVEGNEWVDGNIKDNIRMRLPSVKDGWRFNFNKHAKKKESHTYVLVTEETPNTIEGCLVYVIDEKMGLYMAYIEIAPHNRGKVKKYKLVAECLVAYAAMLSYIMIDGVNKGWLTFDVMEENEEDQIKLMSLYSKKYQAMRVEGETAMYIQPKDTEILIERYLKI